MEHHCQVLKLYRYCTSQLQKIRAGVQSETVPQTTALHLAIGRGLPMRGFPHFKAPHLAAFAGREATEWFEVRRHLARELTKAARAIDDSLGTHWTPRSFETLLHCTV